MRPGDQEKEKKRPRNMDNLSDESHLSNVLTHAVTKVINVPVLSDHFLCGLSGALFNMTIQNLDNWRRLIQDPVNGDPSIPEAYADPRVGDKVVLHIMDGLIALYAGAPMGDANYAIHYGTLYASKDPVALDAIALRMIDQWRIEAQMEPASKIAKYLPTAFTYWLRECRSQQDRGSRCPVKPSYLLFSKRSLVLSISVCDSFRDGFA